jgi:hypothetical protein
MWYGIRAPQVNITPPPPPPAEACDCSQVKCSVPEFAMCTTPSFCQCVFDTDLDRCKAKFTCPPGYSVAMRPFCNLPSCFCAKDGGGPNDFAGKEDNVPTCS